MAPRRKRITPLGQHLRSARQAMGVDQKTFAAMCSVSDRSISRWENGQPPTPAQRQRILRVCDDADAVSWELFRSMADVLNIILPPDSEPVVAPPPPPPPEPPRVEPPRPSFAELRAEIDAVVFAAAEERDVVPRHLRAFGVELLQAVERLGLGAGEAVKLVVARERTKQKVLPAGASEEGESPT